MGWSSPPQANAEIQGIDAIHIDILQYGERAYAAHLADL